MHFVEKVKFAEKVKEGVSKVGTYWKTPPLGKYVTYKEMIAYGVGGMGVQFVIYFAGLIALSATSFWSAIPSASSRCICSIWRLFRP